MTAQNAIRDWWYSPQRELADTSKEAAKSLLAALNAAGYAVVPIEPTPSMFKAYRWAIHNHIGGLPEDQRERIKGRPRGFRVKTKVKFTVRWKAAVSAGAEK